MTYDLHAGTEVSEVIEDASKAKAAELAALVDELLAEKRLKDAARTWPINWGDLGCRNIALVADVWPYPEDPHWSVLIEETESEQLAVWVRDRLAERGWPNVEVKCEW